jgi:hypothetical protein
MPFIYSVKFLCGSSRPRTPMGTRLAPLCSPPGTPPRSTSTTTDKEKKAAGEKRPLAGQER